jgi:hypothetical protein
VRARFTPPASCNPGSNPALVLVPGRSETPEMRKFALALVLMLTPVAARSQSFAMPDWAALMLGQWHGSGVRVELATRRSTLVETQVSAEWIEAEGAGALVSRNRIHEVVLGPDGKPVASRQYDRIYWITEVSRDGSVARLAFGSGAIPGQSPGATGTFDSETGQMASAQVVGGSIRVEVFTDFSKPGEAATLERVFIGPSLHSEAQLTFVRSKN